VCAVLCALFAFLVGLCRYACILLVAGVGILGFRDPHGIRPLVYGTKKPTAEDPKTTHVLSSESVN
jgi:amidophosphoribosyltransferase